MQKQPVAWKEYCVEYWLKELQESMDKCTDRRDITEKNVGNGVKHHTIDQLYDGLDPHAPLSDHALILWRK